MSSVEKITRIIRSILETGNTFDKIVCLLTYMPVRLFRGIFATIAGNIYRATNSCKGEKLGILLSRSKLRAFPLFLKLPDGNKIFLFLRDFSSLGPFKEIYDDEIYERFYVPCQGDTVLDIGAHIGVFTLKACRKKAFVIAIEPDPYNFSLLRRNVALNSYQNRVVQINVALGNEDGHAKFFKSECFSVGSSLTIKRYLSQQVNVRICKIDTLIRKLNIKAIDFLKVDAEGAELDIIIGARTCLRKHVIRNIAIAAYHVSKAEREQLVKILRKYRYNTLLTAHGYIYATACPA